MKNDNIYSIINEIDQYYQATFIADPERCMATVMALLNKIEGLSRKLSAADILQTNIVLSDMLASMEAKDYVRLRDCLYYELKPMLFRLGDFQDNGA